MERSGLSEHSEQHMAGLAAHHYTGTTHQLMAADFTGANGRQVISSQLVVDEGLSIGVDLLVPRITTNGTTRLDPMVAHGSLASGETAAEISVTALEP